MDMKLDILILLNVTPPQRLVLAPGAIFRGNTVCCKFYDKIKRQRIRLPLE